ncbi:hypothetical protein [Noviherbaspirillum malthae]|uniref:hypothetical protein n=1 Tax=Noviherbaspirillum malthae TaxID=1260987 RepID=UPI00188E8A72|nr:hypothetical protein [Noviherbaspirillum malthae]
MKNIVIILFLSFVTFNSYAQFSAVEGEYSSATTHLQVIVLDSEKGIVAAKASVVQGSCSGNIAGIGRVLERKIMIEPYIKLEGSEGCNLLVEFDSKWKTATVLENDYCMGFHGASCGWEGQSVTKRPNKR